MRCAVEYDTWKYHAEIATQQEIEDEREEADWWSDLYDTMRPSDDPEDAE